MDEYRSFAIENEGGRWHCPECNLWRYPTFRALCNAIDRVLARQRVRATRRSWRYV